MIPTLPVLLVAAGVGLIGYKAYASTQLQRGQKVVVPIGALVGVTAALPVPKTLDLDILLEVMSIEGDTVTGRVLGEMGTGKVLAADRVGMVVTFPKSAVKSVVKA